MSSHEKRIAALEDEIAELQAERRAATTLEERVMLLQAITAKENRLIEIIKLSGSGTGEYLSLVLEKLAKGIEEVAVAQKRVSFVVEEVAVEQKRVNFAVEEVVVEQKRVNFAVKQISDAYPSNFGVITPSEDCKTDKNKKYRILMRALQMCENSNVLALAESILNSEECIVAEFKFNWATKNESASYKPFQEYLLTAFGFRAVILAEGEGLADGLLYDSDIYTLRPRMSDHAIYLKEMGKEPKYRFRIRGRTDLGVFKAGAILGCGDLLIAFEVKPKSKFTSEADINRALREGVLQLIGMNADNQYTSPVVIVSALVGKRHYLLYLDIGDNPEHELKYYLRVKSSVSIGQLICFAQSLLRRGCITSQFASPPTPTGSPPHASPEKGEVEEDDDFDTDNVSIRSA